MNRIIITVLITLVANCIYAQNNLTGTIVDKVSTSPLSYVNIGIQNTKKGTVSNEKGVFEIQSISNQETVDLTQKVFYHELSAGLAYKIINNRF